MKPRIVVGYFLSILFVLSATGAPPPEIDYQGKILISDVPLTGPGYFKYAITDEAGTTNFWAHDGTTVGEPTTFITNDCYNGVFNVILGGAPMQDIDPNIFALDTQLLLRVWFSTDGATFHEMQPAQDLLSSPYALNSHMVDGYHAADLVAAATNAFTETDPVFSSSAAAGVTAGDISTWNTAYGWGNHASAGYATGTPVYAETDPVWTTSSTNFYTKTQADGRFVEVNGDTMTGALYINSPEGLRISSDSLEIMIGPLAFAEDKGVAVGAYAKAPRYSAALGWAATARAGSVAVGAYAEAPSNGVAVGEFAKAEREGVALGWWTVASNRGAAVGPYAKALDFGAAVGVLAAAQNYGAAFGWGAVASNSGVAIGHHARGTSTNIAIGVESEAQGSERIAIGHKVTNEVDNTARIRGDLYMDGGRALYGRPTFGAGSFEQLVPLPLLANVVYVATNGSSSGPGTIDRPFKVPQTGYDYAAATYSNEPATLVIAGGTYTVYGGLNMHAGNVHVLGYGRPQLEYLSISAPANSIVGKQCVENIVVTNATIVSNMSANVEFRNCGFEGGLFIEGSRVGVQDCYAKGLSNAPAVTVGDGSSTTRWITIHNSSIFNKSSAHAALLVNQLVRHLKVIGCEIGNLDPEPNVPAAAAIEDRESGLDPFEVPHLYSHNVIRRALPGAPQSPPAVSDPFVANGRPTIVFVQNTVFGDVGVGSHLQFYANNIVYGTINNDGGNIGWTQAGYGYGIDWAGNTEHQLIYPPF